MKIYEVEAGQKEKIPTKGFSLSQLNSDCSEALRIYRQTGEMLFRGVSNKKSLNPFSKNPEIFLSSPRENRKPKDLSNNIQDIFDSYFKFFNFGALRSNSIFCTSDLSMAELYGKPYAIIPKDGFSFTWSPIIKDLAQPGAISEINKGFETIAKTSEDPDSARKAFIGRIYTNKNFADAIKSGHEVMINGPYYAISVDFFKN